MLFLLNIILYRDSSDSFGFFSFHSRLHFRFVSSKFIARGQDAFDINVKCGNVSKFYHLQD